MPILNKDPMSPSQQMDTTPNEDELWREIGGHFETFTQVACEFIDNSKANYDGNDRPSQSIHIALEEKSDGRMLVQIEDQGTGIDNLEAALRLGDKSHRDSPLNEHGFGLKHALASGNPDNDNWAIYTRNKSEVNSGQYRVVSNPYRFDMSYDSESVQNQNWPGVYNGSGTLVQFKCTRSFFDTVHQGVPGQVQRLDTAIDYLVEDLGYIYSKNISDGDVSITVESSSASYSETVTAVTPSINGRYSPGNGTETRDLGGGDVDIYYEFGEMDKSDYKKYYKRSMSTSGVEIRMNGRLIEDNLFSEIWDKERHPLFNHFIGLINLESDDTDRLPATKTAKNGIRSGDEKLAELYQWIRNTLPKPPKETTDQVTENDLLDMLQEYKQNHIPSPSKRVEREFDLFTNISSAVPADLYVYDGTNTHLYEGKKDTAGIDGVYQLMMYWDGAVKDGLDPDKGILIASDFSQGARDMISEINRRTDANGNSYNFEVKNWQDENVNYPP